MSGLSPWSYEQEGSPQEPRPTQMRRILDRFGGIARGYERQPGNDVQEAVLGVSGLCMDELRRRCRQSHDQPEQRD